MDIQVSSNLERALFDLYDRDGPALARAMAEFRLSGRLQVGEARWRRATAVFSGFRLDDPGTLDAIAAIYKSTGELVDPHTAVAVAAAEAWAGPLDVPVVALATAHPAKFPDATWRATGLRPALPPRLADIFERPERVEVLANDLARLKSFIRDRHSQRSAA
jgi:threonine synthase